MAKTTAKKKTKKKNDNQAATGYVPYAAERHRPRGVIIEQIAQGPEQKGPVTPIEKPYFGHTTMAEQRGADYYGPHAIVTKPAGKVAVPPPQAATVPTWQARAADYYGPNAVHGAGGGLPPITDAGPSELDQLLASLGAAPDRGAYMRPFDEAEQRANAAYKAAGPEIAQQYDQLRQQIGQGASDADARQAQILAAVGADQSSARSTIEQLQGGTARDLAAQSGGLTPSLDAGSAVTANQNIANLLAQAQAQKTLLGNTANAEDQSIGSRRLDADAGQAAAGANARNNLDSILNQLGLGRAQAERQYQGDVQQRGAQEAELRMKYHQQELDTLQEQQKAADQMAKALDRVSTTPSQDFQKGMVDRAARFPMATKVFRDIVGAAKGKGEMGLSHALEILAAAAPHLQQGQFALSDDTPVPNRIDPTVIANWLKAYYDDSTKRPNPDALAQLGIDPSALGL